MQLLHAGLGGAIRAVGVSAVPVTASRLRELVTDVYAVDYELGAPICMWRWDWRRRATGCEATGWVGNDLPCTKTSKPNPA